MCGIAGFINGDEIKTNELRAVISEMTKQITHRGPDDEGFWFEENARVAFGHRRLSILDLSPLGHQPMTSATGRYVLILNGEIYNFKILRAELQKQSIQFRGNSDTEVFLAAVEAWGFEESLKRSIGMFAIALWDKQMKTLFLARDRVGEKPLYYGWVGKSFLFASELKALRVFPKWSGEIDRDVLSSFLKFGYVPSPKSIYKNIKKLTPATFLKIDLENSIQFPEEKSYWSAKNHAQPQKIIPELERQNLLDALLKDAVSKQMLSDVPLGAFLSGGIDSSLIVSLMQMQSAKPVKTFSIGFEEEEFNEAPFAKEVARYLKTDHTELYITSQDALDMIPELSTLYDEPFADSSQIPTTLLSRLTRKHVTVSLSGDGGDELFGGYHHYFTSVRIWKLIEWLPLRMRLFIAALLPVTPKITWDLLEPILKVLVGEESIHARLSEKIPQVGNLLKSENFSALYCQLVYQSYQMEGFVLGSDVSATLQTQNWMKTLQEKMMFEDFNHYLPDDILTKVDRASMSVGLESRAPFLDHRIVEFAWQTPLSEKIRDQKGKWILRKILSRYVPENLYERPKRGFSVPVSEWLRGPLKSWAADQLSSERIKREGFLNPEIVQKIWSEQSSGRNDSSQQVWSLLMFQSWLESVS